MIKYSVRGINLPGSNQSFLRIVMGDREFARFPERKIFLHTVYCVASYFVAFVFVLFSVVSYRVTVLMA